MFWCVCEYYFLRRDWLSIIINEYTQTYVCMPISWAIMIPLEESKFTSENATKIKQHRQHLPRLINSGLNLLLSGKSEALASRHPPAIRLNVPGILTFYWFQSKGYVKKAARSPKWILATNTLGESQTTKTRKKDKMQTRVTELKQPQPGWWTFKDKATHGPGILFG